MKNSIMLMLLALLTTFVGDLHATESGEKATGERFVCHALQDQFDNWPTDVSQKDKIIARLREVDYSLSQLRAFSVSEHHDDRVVEMCDSARKLVLAYQTFLREIGAIDNSTSLQFQNDLVGSVESGLQAGSFAHGAMKFGNVDSDRAAAGSALLGVIASLGDAYLRQQERDAAYKRKVESAEESLRRAWNDTKAETSARARKIEDAYGWVKGSVGHDGFPADDLDALLSHRPDDPFVRAAHALAKGEAFHKAKKGSMLGWLFSDGAQTSPVADTLVAISEETPKSALLDQYRARFLGEAVRAATNAAVKDLGESASYSDGPSPKAGAAIDVCTKYLDLSLADKGHGYLNLARAYACNKQFDDAVAAANSVPESDRGATFCFVYARLACLTGSPDKALGWLQKAIRLSGMGVVAARSSPDFASLRTSAPEAFEEIVRMKWRWSMSWGYRIGSDSVTIHNDSEYPLLDVEFTPTVSSTGYADWSTVLRCARVEPGKSFTWDLGVGGITSRGDDAGGKATLQARFD